MGARTPANEPYHENAIGAAIDGDCPREQRRSRAQDEPLPAHAGPMTRIIPEPRAGQ